MLLALETLVLFSPEGSVGYSVSKLNVRGWVAWSGFEAWGFAQRQPRRVRMYKTLRWHPLETCSGLAYPQLFETTIRDLDFFARNSFPDLLALRP